MADLIDDDGTSSGAASPDAASPDAVADGASLWRDLRRFTNARVGQGRAGASTPTAELLKFELDHARARDAVNAAFDVATIAAQLERSGLGAACVDSRAASREIYLRRPDLGRRLAPESRAFLSADKQAGETPVDICLVVGDGLSAAAVHGHAVALIDRLRPALSDFSFAPHVILARGARVALGDEIGEILQARLTILLIGERPGLAAPDSLGVYLTFAPRLGRTDAERNCVSNIHARGLSYEAAAFKCAWLARAALAKRETGVGLKDESGRAFDAIS